MLAPLCGSASVTTLFGRLILMPSRVPRGVSDVCPSWTSRSLVPGLSIMRVGPTEHPLVPQTHVGRRGLEDRPGVRPRGHEVPEVDIGVRCTGGVVEVRQSQGRGRTRARTHPRPSPRAARCSSRPGDRRCRGWCTRRQPRTSAPRSRRRPAPRRHRTCPRRSGRAPGGRRRRRARRRCRHRRGRPGPRCRSRPMGSWAARAASASTASVARRPGPSGLSGWPFIACGAGAIQFPAASWTQREAPYQASECGTFTHGVAAPETVYAPFGHFQVHVAHRVAGEADARLAVRTREIGPNTLGDAGAGVQHLVEVLGREVLHPHRVVVRVRQRRRVGDVVVQRAVLHVARDARAALEHRRGHHGAGEAVAGRLVELHKNRQQLGGLGVLSPA